MNKIVFILFSVGFHFSFAQVKKQETSIQSIEKHSQNQSDSEKHEYDGYPGGIMKLRKDITDKLNVKKLRGTGTISSNAKVIIGTKGKIDSIVVVGDNIEFNTRIEKAIRSLEATWKPAQQNGKLVRSYYRIPFTLSFD